MSNLVIEKDSLKVWKHIDSVLGTLIVSKFYFVTDNNKFQLVSKGKAYHNEYDIPTQVTLIDNTGSGTTETFANALELSLRLEELNYPAFQVDGQITNIANLIEAGTNVTITGDGTLASPYVISSSGGGSADQDNIFRPFTVSLATLGASDFADSVPTKLATWIASQSITITDIQLPIFEVTSGTISEMYVLKFRGKGSLNSVVAGDLFRLKNAPSLQNVTDSGNETTDDVIFRLDADRFIKINSATQSIEFFDLGVLSTSYSYFDKSMFNLGNPNTDWQIGIDVDAGTIGIADNSTSKTLVVSKSGIGLDNIYYPFPTGETSPFAKVVITKTSNFTAELNQSYTSNGTITVTDPTPEANKGYIVHVIGGTSTIGGVAYTTGALVYRYYNGTAWVSTDMNSQLNVNTLGAVVNGSATATPNDTDLVLSVESSVAKKNTWTQIKAFLKTYFDTIYTTTSAVASQITTALVGYATQAYADGKVQNNLTASTTVAPSSTAVNNALNLKADNSIIDRFKKGVQFFTDFDNTASNITGFVNNNSGGGTAVLATNTIPNRQANQIGFAQYQTITSASSYIFHQTGLTNFQFGLGNGTWVYETAVLIDDLSTVTERFNFRAGFGSSNFANTETDAVMFIYDEGGVQNGTTASGNWQVVTSSNNTRTVTNTTTTIVADTWYVLRIEINADGTSVVFKVNGTTVATHTTNIPTFAGSRFVNVKQGIAKTIGTTNRNVFCDYIGYENILTSPR